MVLGTVDRIDNGILVLITHSDPFCEIHLPLKLFPGFNEGDIVHLIVEKDWEIEREMKKEIRELRKGLKRKTLE